jgi:outer membrane murein-binding lipoprotein Lpp
VDAPAQPGVVERLLEHADRALTAIAAVGLAVVALIRHWRGRLPGLVFDKVRRDPQRETRVIPRAADPGEAQVDQVARDGVTQLRAQVEALEETVRAQATEFRRADEAIVARVEHSIEALRVSILALTREVGELVGLSRRRRAGEGGE